MLKPSNGDDEKITLHMHTVILLSVDGNYSDYTNTILNELDGKHLDKYNGDFDTWLDEYVKYKDSNNKCQIIH